jgi:alpha-mannosidase
MATPTLYMIGNAHLDPVWLWRWQEGFQEAKATFRSALDRLREDPEFVFTSSSAAIYEWVEHNDPAMFAEIRARVAEGRWQIVGGWWIQPDCNLPGGESFARQGLYGQRYFLEKFGVLATVGYNVDSFGHHAMLPQILRLSGMEAYVMMRPEPYEKGLPGRLFWWESDDGAAVLAFRIPYEYCTWGRDLERHVRRCAAELKPPFDALMCFYGVGNHGGGPTRENLASIRRMQHDPTLPRLHFSGPNEFFADMRACDLPFPIVHDELQHHASGCYAAHSGIKRWNREGENALLAAEKWSAIAARATGLPYPDLSRAWKNLLFNQFHDILGGTSIEAAYDDARDLHGETMAIAGRALNDAVQSLAWKINIPFEEGVRPVVVCNPHAWPVRANLEIEMNGLAEGDALLDDEGRRLPLQIVAPGMLITGWRRRATFTADLPPLGYRVFRVAHAGSPAAEAATEVLPGELAASETTLENGRFRLQIDPATGFIASLYDKRHGCEVFRGPAAVPAVIHDPSDTWSHGVYQFHDACGAFAARRVRLVERGPVRATILVESEYGASRLAQRFILYADRELIDVQATVDWREQFKLLKLRFPLNLHFWRATYEIPFGHIERPTNGEEEPGQSWVDLSGESRDTQLPYGMALLNDGKYSFDAHGPVLSMTVLRSPIYAHHLPTEPEPDEPYSFIDQGVQRFCYALLPHAGGWEGAGVPRSAAELNQRPVVLNESCHDGPLSQRASYLEAEPANIVVTAVKQAEDGGDLIVRCYETERRETEAIIRLPQWGRAIHEPFGPCEIRTFRIPLDPGQPVAEIDLLEREGLRIASPPGCRARQAAEGAVV